MKRTYFTGSLLALASSIAFCAPAYANDAADEEQAKAKNDGEIVVTAQRREQALQDVPLAVTAVSAETLEAKSIRGLADFPSGSVPGMQLAPFTGTPSILGIVARGVGMSDPTQGTQELAVPLYIDGVPLGRAQGLGLELIDPERVEFLRGPQGQLFGRNAEGGAVQFVSRRPSGELGVDLAGKVGNFGMDSQRLRVDLPEFAGIRLQGAVSRTQRDALTINGPKGVYSEQADYGLLDSLGFRIAAEANPTESLRINYTYDNSRIDDSQPYLVWVPVDIIGRPPRSPQPAGNDEYPRRTNSPTYNEEFRTKSSGHALTIEFEASENITLKSISSYREASRHGSSTLGDGLVAGGSSTGIVRSNAREDVDQEQWYQEVQFIGSWDNFDLTVGGTYFQEKVVDERRSYLTGPGFNAPALGLSPATLVNCIGLEKCMTARSEQNAQSDSYGVYAQGTYYIGDSLELTAGIRYSDDKKVAQRTYIAPPALPPYLETSPSGALPPSRLFRAKRWDPAFTVKYNFSESANVYLRYATAYRAGGANVRSSTFSNYDEEEIRTWELGFKTKLLDDRMTFNVAFYHNKIDGVQSNIQEAPATNPSLTNTVNLVTPFKVKGLEIESSFRVTDGLTLSLGYSYMDAPKWTEFDNPLTAVVDVTRFYTIQTPKHSGNIGFDYETDIGIGTLAFHSDYSFASKFWSTPGAIQLATMGPTYDRPATKTSMLNARLALKDVEVGGANLEVAVFGKNLLDETNYLYAFDGAASGGGMAQFLQEPLTYGLEMRVKF